MDVLGSVMPIIYGAVVVEAVVNIVRNVQQKETDWRYWSALGLGLGVGVLVALTYSLDFFAMIGLEARIPFVGAVLTGLIISRGANVVNDVIGLIGRSARPS